MSRLEERIVKLEERITFLEDRLANRKRRYGNIDVAKLPEYCTQIINHIYKANGINEITPEMMRRSKEFVTPRWECLYVLNNFFSETYKHSCKYPKLKMSLRSISSPWGQDHATVIHVVSTLNGIMSLKIRESVEKKEKIERLLKECADIMDSYLANVNVHFFTESNIVN